MRKIERGPEPQSLIDARNLELEEAREHYINDKKTKNFKFKAYKKAKLQLKKITGGNCAYCEGSYDATSPYDLEHYRPKGAIETPTGRLKPGYWWLAAVWENLLPSCIKCNREETQAQYDGSPRKTGKGNKFPLFIEADRALDEGDEKGERPVLIDPAVDDPADFIRFVKLDDLYIAKCVDASEQTDNGKRARQSIDVYGLNRVGLVEDRSRQLLRAEASLRQLELAIAELDKKKILGEDAAFVESTISRESEFLGSLTRGDDRFTGILRALIYPEMARLGVELK